MWNFIENFLNEIQNNWKEKNNLESNKIMDLSELSNDNSGILKINDKDRILKWANNLIDNKDIMSKNIKIEKKSYKKTILWIIFQFIAWIFLIAYSYSYLQNHEAEMKFFDSSIQYWKNLTLNLYAKLWWNFENQVDKEYINKRNEMVNILSNLSEELNACIAKEKNTKTLLQLTKTKSDIDQLKKILSDTNYLPLNKYIEKYQYYSLWVHSLKEWVENYCK